MASPPLGLISGCFICHRKDSLSLCTGCKVVKYCSIDHQRQDRPTHKSNCKSIAKKTAILAQERHETALFAAHGKGLSAILGSGSLIDPLLQLANAYLQIDSPPAVQSGLKLLLEMVDITKDPQTGPQDIAPACFLRLGQDQEAYDFLKWWVTSPEPSGPFKPSAQLYKDTEIGANVFEDVSFFMGRCPSLSFMTALTLLKLRLLISLQALQRSVKIGEDLPMGSLDEVNGHLTSSAISQRKYIIERGDHSKDIENLSQQVKTMYEAVQEANSYFWAAVLNPGQGLTAESGIWNFGSKQEKQLALKCSLKAWKETPGAIEMIKTLQGGRVNEPMK